MSPDSLGAQIVAVLLTVLSALVVAAGWNLPLGPLRWPLRVGGLFVSVLLAAVSVGIGVNRQLYLYPTWGDVLGLQNSATTVANPASVDAQGSEIVEIKIPGRYSHVSLSAYVYLPAAYGSAVGQAERFPVIEAFPGFPGSPLLWTYSLGAQRYLDTEIAAGRMAPTVVVFPYITTPATHDGECVNAVAGPQFDTFLSIDVPDAIIARYRVRTDRFGWSTLGTSTGGFCAVNLALRHPDRYSVAVSLSGYFTALTDRTTGDLYRGNLLQREENSPLWRIEHLPVPQLSVFLGAAGDDRDAAAEIKRFRAVAREPLSLSVMVIKQGGHSGRVWAAMEPVVFDWISARLAGPEPLTAAG